MVFHFLGGLAIAHGTRTWLRWLTQRQRLSIKPAELEWYLVLGMVALAATLWEFAEFGVEALWGVRMQQGLPDTMGDMALGLMGGLVLLLW